MHVKAPIRVSISAAVAAFAATALALPAAAASFELAPEPAPYDDSYVCDAGYFSSTQKWEVSWGNQYDYAGSPEYSSTDFGGLTYIDPQYTGKTASDELQKIENYNSDKTSRNAAYHWWYPSREMVKDGSKLVLGFEDGTVISGEATVGNGHCPSIRWIQYNADGTVAAERTPSTYPVAPLPPKPEIPTDSGGEPPSLPFGSLGSLGSLFPQ
ncbi:hypothetical protein [Tomitella cavernea]|uniref:Secreted protein n=1 Tax=Tomitella cavernea TaxID=1387982 RepID=A0ABP9D1K2_9ACTN|nr:hypothetical protein [Tomitella cavernea]